jgi:hypothetical protein
MTQPLSGTSAMIGMLVSRIAVPLWLLTGAGIKLWERSPMLLPSPVRDTLKAIANAMGQGGETEFAAFLDLALRVIVSAEFALAAAMMTLPAISRRIAIPMLSMFVLILLAVVARGEASCGCFGSKGPPPWVVLAGDVALLVLAIRFRPAPSRIHRMQVGAWIACAALGVAITFTVPPRDRIEHTAPPQDPAPARETAKPTEAPPKSSPETASASWPSPPATLQPYYLPQFEQWVGKPLRAQPIAALITGPVPADLEQGRWIVMFFREDCEHCHAVLDRHFSPKVPMSTLLVSVPDADPAASLPNPCGECQVRTLPKGPDWVIGTPVLLSLQDGVVKGVLAGTDAEDPERVEALMQFR